MSSVVPPTKLSIFGLPVELRNEIYRNLLSTRRTKVNLGLGRACYSLQVAILRVNHQIYDESNKIFQENRFICISTPWSAFKADVLTQGKFPLIAEDEKALFFKNWHLIILLDWMGDPHTGVFYNFLTCLEDLPLLCKLLFYTGCQSDNFNSLMHITLELKDPHAESEATALPKALQESLLMPFAILKGLDGVTIKGSKLKSVEKKLRKALQIPNPTAAGYLEEAAKLKDAGNAAFRAGDYAQSIRLYVNAYEAMHFVIDGKRFAIMLDCYFASNLLNEGRFARQRGDLIRHQLGSRLSWNIIQAYIKLEDWDQAYYWGERAISDIEYANVQQSILDGTPNLITNSEKAKVYYRMFLVAKRLDNKQVWARSLMKAAIYTPKDKLIRREMHLLETRLQSHELEKKDFGV
ncbi:hypothetical protein MMC28_005040 [Mycoblastus sanguinarius]|nr:hypothetical protein [Mycoblastus sanguinarius]